MARKKKKQSHSMEFLIVGILILIGIVAIASYVLTTDDLTKAQIEGKAAGFPKSGNWRIFLEERFGDVPDGDFTVRLFVEYIGSGSYYSNGELHAECDVNGVMDSNKILYGSLERAKLRTLYVSGNAEGSKRVHCNLMYNDIVLQSIRKVY